MIILYILVSTLALDVATADDELLAVDVVLRHGDRAATQGWATPESEQILFRGHDMLTDDGIDNSHKQGRDFRKRYVKTGFLDQRYLPKEVNLQSSPVDRCLMTSASFSHALFTTTSDKNVITPPIRSKDMEADWMTYPHLECDDGWSDVSDRFNLTTEHNIASAASEALQITDWDCPTVPSDLFDAIVSEVNNKLIDMPEDYRQCAKKKGRQYMYKYIELLAGAGENYNPIRLRRNSGLLVNQLITNFNATSACESPCTDEYKMRIYVTHDVVLLAIAHAFGFLDKYENVTPAFASAIIFETYRNPTTAGTYVKIFRKDGHKADWDYTHNCDGDCSLAAVTQSVAPFATDTNIPCGTAPKCQSCSSRLITLAIDGNNDHEMDADVIDRGSESCTTRTFTCRGVDANIEVNDGENGVVTNHTNEVTFKVTCNGDGSAWVADGVAVTRLECASGYE